MPIDPDTLDPSAVQRIDADASVLMKRGIGLMGQGGPVAIAEALDCFDRARALRSQLPVETVPLLRYGLAACWLNRAEALVRLEDPTRIAAALHAFDQGLLLLRDLPLGDDPRFPRRLSIAHQNRGLALHAQGPSGAAEAIVAFTEAIAVLEHESAADVADRQHMLSAIWLNLAVVTASAASDESESMARQAARRAIALVADSESDNADAAEVGLRARHVLCQTLAARLSRTIAGGQIPPEDVHDATDAADEALDLVRRWEHKDVVRFRGLAYDLFRFGGRVYARYQPQFLEEFIRDNMDPERSSSDYVGSAEMRAAALDVAGLTGN